MKKRHALLKSSVLAVSTALAVGALWWNETTAQTVSSTSVQQAWNTSLVSVSGTVTGSPESVKFSGSAKVGTRLAPDPDFGSPSLVVSIDLTGVSGVGASTRTKYVINGPEIVQKRVAPSYTIDLTFPFSKSGTDGTTGARSGAATFSFTVDGTTGAISSPQGIIVSSSL